MEEIIAPVLTALITGALTLLGIWVQNRKRDAERETKSDMQWRQLNDWQERVETKLDEHNGYAQKFAESSIALARIDERLKNLEGRKN